MVNVQYYAISITLNKKLFDTMNKQLEAPGNVGGLRKRWGISIFMFYDGIDLFLVHWMVFFGWCHACKLLKGCLTLSYVSFVFPLLLQMVKEDVLRSLTVFCLLHEWPTMLNSAVASEAAMNVWVCEWYCFLTLIWLWERWMCWWTVLIYLCDELESLCAFVLRNHT